MAERVLLDEQIRHNKAKSALILALAFLVLFLAVVAAGFLLSLPLPVALGIGLLAGLLYLLVTASSGVGAILAATRARPANPNVREEKLLLYRIEELSIASGLPKPRVYVQDSRDINAFAAGRNPNEAIVCVTTGALQQLNQEELEGVLAHELSHIKNYDVRVATLTIAVVGIVAILAEIVLRGLWWGGARGARHGRGGGGGAGAAILIVLSIVFIVLAPLISRLVYFAMSRRREYLADASGAMLTRNPDGLAMALHKIRLDLPDDPKGSTTVAALYIANPWKRALRESVWSTHPPLEKRIERLMGEGWEPAPVRSRPQPPIPSFQPTHRPP